MARCLSEVSEIMLPLKVIADEIVDVQSLVFVA
jgi:hypothetical protein